MRCNTTSAFSPLIVHCTEPSTFVGVPLLTAKSGVSAVAVTSMAAREPVKDPFDESVPCNVPMSARFTGENVNSPASGVPPRFDGVSGPKRPCARIRPEGRAFCMSTT
jgi:hypothetical protein